MIIYVSDFDLRGSGYMNIGVSLCDQLAANGHEVIAIGLGYNRQEHQYPFTIVPAQRVSDIAPMIAQIDLSNIDIEAVIVALDIPLQEKMVEQLGVPNEIPYIGLFPLEAGPLCQTWALSLHRMDARLVMSEFAAGELALQGLESAFIPLGLDTNAWRQPVLEERERIRDSFGVDDNTFVILTVADNQERKNLSRSMEIFADFAKTRSAVYWLVTRPDSPVGWKLTDYAQELGILDKFHIFKRGLPFRQLWGLYAAADAFLLTSKAEGLAMPVLEAMACGVPVVGTKCAAIEEHLSDGRGLLIEPDYVHIDPWGNSRRYLASREDGLYKLRLWADGMNRSDRLEMLNKAAAYIQARTWDKAGRILLDTIEEVKRGEAQTATAAAA